MEKVALKLQYGTRHRKNISLGLARAEPLAVCGKINKRNTLLGAKDKEHQCYLEGRCCMQLQGFLKETRLGNFTH